MENNNFNNEIEQIEPQSETDNFANDAVKNDGVNVDSVSDKNLYNGFTQETSEEPKKRGRGRPRKDGSNPKPKTESLRSPILKDTTPDLLSAYSNDFGSTNEEAKPIESNAQENQQKISGALLLIVVDSIIPFGASLAANRWMGKKTTIKQMKMTKEEKESLKELAEAAASQMSVNMSPTSLFLVSCLFIYGSKLAMAE